MPTESKTEEGMGKATENRENHKSKTQPTPAGVNRKNKVPQKIMKPSNSTSELRRKTISRIHSASKAYVQMNNLNQNDLTKKLAYLVGEYQNRYWYAQKRREIMIREINSSLNFLQMLIYNDRFILTLIGCYFGIFAAVTKTQKYGSIQGTSLI